MRELLERQNAEEQKRREDAKAARAAAKAATPKTRTIRRRVDEDASLFQVFDRSCRDAINRGHLAACLHAADPDSACGEYRSLATLGGTAHSEVLDLVPLSTDVTEELVTPPPSPKKASPKKSPANEATKAAEGDAEMTAEVVDAVEVADVAAADVDADAVEAVDVEEADVDANMEEVEEAAAES
eukprot:TRINITY_DN3354_c0_g1_i2.p3 TRINITY_DN3354_c0_g1~~TRINITY_DN3354_c0_g1_i2.p3  ORF type:complete len:185 (+),score=74.64 TRINITY_DN3354_c0_g1_i2:1313-1867(+)